MDNREKLIALSTAAFGPRWQTETSRALSVSDRSVRAWVAAKTPVADGVITDLAAVVRERLRLLGQALTETEQDLERGDLHVAITTDGLAGSLLLTVDGITVDTGSEGDLIRADVEILDMRDGSQKRVTFAEEIHDGVFPWLNSHFQAWVAPDWFEVLGSDHVVDVVFEAVKGHIRLNRPDLFARSDEDLYRQVLTERGFDVVKRDRTHHYHWLVENKKLGWHGWFASLRAAVDELVAE